MAKATLNNPNLRIIFSVTLCGVMAVSLILPVFPQVVAAMNIDKAEVAWLISVYTIPGILLSPLYGVLADRWGRKRVLVPALTVFGVAGAACGFAPDYSTLLALRFLQGVGGGGLFTLNNTLIGDLFEGHDRVIAMGLNASVISVGTAAYPAIGGLMGALHWRAPFFFTILSLVVAMLVLLMLRTPHRVTVEPLGGYLTTALRDIRRWQNLRLFIVSFIIFATTFGTIASFFPIFIHERFSAPPYVIGGLFTLSSIASALMSSRLGRLSSRFALGRLAAVGFVGYSIAMATLLHMPMLLLTALPMILFGSMQGLIIPSVQSLVINAAPTNSRGAFLSFNSMVILTAISAGPAVAGILFKLIGLHNLFYLAAAAALIIGGLLILTGLDLTAQPIKPGSPPPFIGS